MFWRFFFILFRFRFCHNWLRLYWSLRVRIQRCSNLWCELGSDVTLRQRRCWLRRNRFVSLRLEQRYKRLKMLRYGMLQWEGAPVW
jgi:hypothetical protein